jgi:hypothetical protein
MKILDFFKEKNSSDNIEEIKIVTPKISNLNSLLLCVVFAHRGNNIP